jgi:hypothetical protein
MPRPGTRWSSRSARSRAARRPCRRRWPALRDGAIGEVLVAKAWNSQLAPQPRQGEADRPAAPHLDFDLWLGPAPDAPFYSNRVHGIVAVLHRLRRRRHRQRRRPRHRRRRLGPGVRDAAQPRRGPGRQVLLRRRPGMAGHAVRRLRVRRGQQRQEAPAVHLRAAHLVARTCRRTTRTGAPSTAPRACSSPATASGGSCTASGTSWSRR